MLYLGFSPPYLRELRCSTMQFQHHCTLSLCSAVPDQPIVLTHRLPLGSAYLLHGWPSDLEWAPYHTSSNTCWSRCLIFHSCYDHPAWSGLGWEHSWV